MHSQCFLVKHWAGSAVCGGRERLPKASDWSSTSSTFHPASCAHPVGPLQLRAAKTEGFSVSVAASTLPGELDRQLIISVYYISPYAWRRQVICQICNVSCQRCTNHVKDQPPGMIYKSNKWTLTRWRSIFYLNGEAPSLSSCLPSTWPVRGSCS